MGPMDHWLLDIVCIRCSEGLINGMSRHTLLGVKLKLLNNCGGGNFEDAGGPYRRLRGLTNAGRKARLPRFFSSAADECSLLIS
jgi:hypothetical protein